MSDHSTCPETGKRCFGSIRDAKKSSAKLHNRIRTYLCPFCHCVHITSEKKL